LDNEHKHHFHGRRISRPLRAKPQSLMDALLPQIRLRRDDGLLKSPAQLFKFKPNDIWLEVGFGGGEHLAHRAAENPDIGFIGAEPFVNGVAKLLAHIDAQAIENIRICDDDVRYLLENLATASIGRAFVLYPDPWPKARHNKRRIISDSFLNELARVLRPDAEFLFASDIPDYCAWTLDHIRRNGKFDWLAEQAADWRLPPEGWPGTRYEAKAIREGRTPCYLQFRRKA
jgi:tRNA (guanine-N7-)-methyltransferase